MEQSGDSGEILVGQPHAGDVEDVAFGDGGARPTRGDGFDRAMPIQTVDPDWRSAYE